VTVWWPKQHFLRSCDSIAGADTFVVRVDDIMYDGSRSITF
jgi:hypothetical protein